MSIVVAETVVGRQELDVSFFALSVVSGCSAQFAAFASTDLGYTICIVIGFCVLPLVLVLLLLRLLLLTPEGKPGDFCSLPPCLESQGCKFDPTFLYLLSCQILLPSPVALSALSFSAFGPFS